MPSIYIAIHCLTAQEAVDIKNWNCSTSIVGNDVNLPLIESLANPGKTRVKVCISESARHLP